MCIRDRVGTAASSTGRPLRPSERARIGIDLDAWAKLRQHPLAELQARLRQSVALYLPAGAFAALFLLAVPVNLGLILASDFGALLACEMCIRDSHCKR